MELLAARNRDSAEREKGDVKTRWQEMEKSWCFQSCPVVCWRRDWELHEAGKQASKLQKAGGWKNTMAQRP